MKQLVDHAINNNWTIWRTLYTNNAQIMKRGNKLYFFDDNVPPRRTNATWDLVESYNWILLTQAVYSLDLAPSDFNLSASMEYETNIHTHNSCYNSPRCRSFWRSRLWSSLCTTYSKYTYEFTPHMLNKIGNIWTNCDTQMII